MTPTIKTLNDSRTIFLFRHGETCANEKKLYCGKTDLPLSEKGRDSLEEKKKSAVYPDISQCKIFTSGMKRTTQTLRLLYPELADSAVEESAFREIDFGDFEMKSYEELKTNEGYIKWVQGEVDRIQNGSTESSENSCPNGESWSKMNERVLEKLNKITNNYRSIAIFTHGGVISAIMKHFFPDEHKSMYEWQGNFGEGWKITLNGTDGNFKANFEKIPNEKS